MTWTASLTSRGRVTLPSALRTALELKAGTALSFTVLSDGAVVMRTKRRQVNDLAGSLTRPGQPSLPVEQLSR